MNGPVKGFYFDGTMEDGYQINSLRDGEHTFTQFIGHQEKEYTATYRTGKLASAIIEKSLHGHVNITHTANGSIKSAAGQENNIYKSSTTNGNGTI
jgi:hypothetical protein